MNLEKKKFSLLFLHTLVNSQTLSVIHNFPKVDFQARFPIIIRNPVPAIQNINLEGTLLGFDKRSKQNFMWVPANTLPRNHSSVKFQSKLCSQYKLIFAKHRSIKLDGLELCLRLNFPQISFAIKPWTSIVQIFLFLPSLFLENAFLLDITIFSRSFQVLPYNSVQFQAPLVNILIADEKDKP